MNLEERTCPLEEHGGLLDPANGPAFWLLETLQQPLGADVWGNPLTWMQTPVGQQLIAQSIDQRELPWRLPVLLSASALWQAERRLALKRFGSPGPKRPRPRVH